MRTARIAACLTIPLAMALPSLAPAQPVAQPVVPNAAPPSGLPAAASPSQPAPVPAAPAAPAVPVQQTAAPAPTPVPAPTELKWSLPLRKLINENEPILLRNASSIYTLFVPQSARFEVRSCRLTLEFTNSIALLTERSVLRVVMNDIIIGQYYLDRDNPNRKVVVDIPTKLIKDGFNRLQFIVAQHYTYKCEDPSAPELYTEINPDTSFIEAVGTLRPVPMRLSHLRWWIDEKIWPNYRFNVGLPGARPMTDLHLAWGAIATQGVALARNYQPFEVNVSNGLREGMDNLIIGTMTELSAFLTATEVGSINGGFLAIKPMPRDPNHCMVIISGRNEQEVGQTALAFGLVNYPLPDSQFATIERLALPNPAPYVRNAPLDLPGIYGFNQLGFRSTTIKGWNTGGFELPIYMPGDISRDDQSNAELRLHFSYGANMRKDSTFNVFINQQFQTAIRLSDINGAMHNGHRLFLPMQAFQPGRNVVSLLPKMVPMYSNFCEILQDENLQFTLYQDSEFVFPKALRRARLPSLGVFSQTAFPFSAPPDGVETAVCVAGKDEASVCAAWTVMGKIAQISGALLHRSEITFKLPRSQKSLLVVGPRDALPTELLERAPVSPLEVGRIRYVVSAIPKPQKIATSGIEEFLQKIRGGQVAKAEPEAPATAELNLTADLAEETVAIQYESPFHLGYPVTLITAGDSTRLLEGARALQHRRIWDNLIGDLAVWGSRPDSLAVAKVGPDFIYKSTSVVTRVATRFDANPWLLGVVLVGTLAGLGWLAAWALRKREARAREAGGGGGTP